MSRAKDPVHEARLKNIAKARKAKARKRKERLAAEASAVTTVVPLDAVPTLPVPVRKPANGRRKAAPPGEDLDALAELIVATFLALKRRSGR